LSSSCGHAEWEILLTPEVKGCSIAKLVTTLFPFKEVDKHSVKQLPSYEDRNYYLAGTTPAGHETMEELFCVENIQLINGC